MATLVPTLTLTSSDTTSDELSFSVTDSLSVTGDTISVSRIALSTSDLTLLTTSYGKSYVYFKNTDSSIVMTIQFGGDSTFTLAAGEFAFFPWNGGANIVALSASGTPMLEYALWEA